MTPSLTVNSYLFSVLDKLTEDDMAALAQLLVLVPQFQKPDLVKYAPDSEWLEACSVYSRI